MNTTRYTILRGIATIMWGSAWADHAEAHHCYNLSGAKIEDCMPEIPLAAWRVAIGLMLDVEAANGGEKLEAAYARIVARDGLDPSKVRSSAEAFGNCLAWEAMGAGVSWEDDNPDHGLDVPHDSSSGFELMMHAGDTCEDEGHARCADCGAYGSRRDPRKCDNCGKKLIPRDRRGRFVSAHG